MEERRKTLHHDDFAPTLADDAPGKEVTGDQKGVTLLVDFSDQQASVSQNHMNELVNGESFETYGSVWEYFYDISGEKLNYKNHVTDYIRAEKQKFYYDDPHAPYGERARELIHEMPDSLYYSSFNYTRLSMEGDQILAVNLFYAGSPDHGWSKGLWPHMSSPLGWTSPDGTITTGSYHITNIGTSPSIGTFCHENGHMLLGQPEWYPYSGDNNWVGAFMSYGFRQRIKSCSHESLF